VTARVRCSTPPPVGHNYLDRTDWWNYILTVPPPRIVIVEDVDERPGTGALVGHVHANILQALGCVAYATNGSVRDLPAVEPLGFQFFAPRTSVSHAFVHIIEFGIAVTIGGLHVASGDVVHGDRHGLLTVPAQIVGAVPEAALRRLNTQRAVEALCQSHDFSLDTLRTLVRQLG
jgi:regulator of RNase E activity RraA